MKKISHVLLAFVSTLFFVLPAFAVDPSEPGGIPAAPRIRPDAGDLAEAAEPDWGSQYSVYFIPAAGFSVMDSTTVWGYGGVGYIYRTGGGSSQFWAPLILPPGALLGGIRLFYYDNSASDITVSVTKYVGDTSPSSTDIISWTSSGTPGYTSSDIPVGETIRYIPGAAGTSEQGYVIIVSLPDASSNMMFKGARVVFSLQVSPKPALATFTDVPLTHPFSQFIEALAAAGITGGCGGGKYCPGNPITRGEMAVFLSAALGLHWQE